MTFRYIPSGLYLWKINIVVLLFLRRSTEKSTFYPVNSCTDIKLKDIPVEVFQTCSETSTAIHCLPDENDNLGLSCFQVTWISKNKCPSYNSYKGYMDEKACTTDYNGICPDDLYKSPESVRYTGCYIKELIQTTTTTMTPTLSSDPMQNISITPGTMNEMNQIDTCEYGKSWKIATIVTIMILLVVLLLIVAGVIKFKLWHRCKKRTKEDSHDMIHLIGAPQMDM